MTDTTIQAVISAVSGAAGVFGSMFWMRYWARRTDRRLDGLESKMEDVRINSAVLASQKAQANGALSQLQVAVNETNQKLGRHEGSIDRLWEVVQKQSELPARLSDS